MEPGTEEQLAGAGRIIVEYSTSRARLAQLMAEVVSVADNFAKISKFIRSANAIAYAKLGDAEIDRIPTPDRFRDLTRAIAEEFENKKRLAASLRELGVDVAEDRGFLKTPES